MEIASDGKDHSLGKATKTLAQQFGLGEEDRRRGLLIATSQFSSSRLTR